MELTKPTITKFQERAKEVFSHLQKNDFVTKKEIAELLNLPLPKYDRQIRDLIAHISHRHPIISTSDSNKGWKLAKDETDIELVKHSWAEIDKRAEELIKRKRPLIKFLDARNVKITLFG